MQFAYVSNEDQLQYQMILDVMEYLFIYLGMLFMDKLCARSYVYVKRLTMKEKEYNK